jgi:hypothetical protein
VDRTLPPLPLKPLSPGMENLRSRTMQAASRLRELNFTAEVGMSQLSGWEYGARTSAMAEMFGGDDLRALSKLAASGGVLPDGTDLATLAASFTAASAGATYSPYDKQILLVDKSRSESLLTHEFVHALQDQHFDLMKLLTMRPFSFDRAEALFAVIEGDAMNVQRRAEEGDAYGRKKLEDIMRQENDRFGEYRQQMSALFPPLVTEAFIFRYRDGARFVETIRRSRGEKGVDQLFANPPVSSAQILHPERYMANELPHNISLDEEGFAANGWRLLTSTPLGEIGVRGLLMAQLPEKDATRAAASWAGDRAFLFENEAGSSLFVWKTIWNNPLDAESFSRTYNELQRHRAGSQPTGRQDDPSQTAWREGDRTTIVRRDGNTVVVLRGLEDDMSAALDLARR